MNQLDLPFSVPGSVPLAVLTLCPWPDMDDCTCRHDGPITNTRVQWWTLRADKETR